MSNHGNSVPIPIAHVRRNEDGVSWAPPQELKDHLSNTAILAAQFAKPFASEEWGYIAGLAHDVGKGLLEWQEYIRTTSGYDEDANIENRVGKIEHSGPGAAFAENILGKGIGRILSYCIAGHHAGLPDWEGGQSSLAFRREHTSIVGIKEEYSADILTHRPSSPPWKFSPRGIDMALWIRMLFSCLVDADFLDTESYMNSSKYKMRAGYLPLRELLGRFNTFMSGFIDEKKNEAGSIVNIARRRVLSDCRVAACQEPGIFSLSVPTGGGKTLSSMAFALEHAVKHDKHRIIYVIPYTSIIEQNADVFRKALGEDQVVEHHSNLDEDDSSTITRLSSENWDAPIIVTTSVQFFESLFAAKTSRCRKLHNIANSVVILDEAQLLPVEFLGPIIEAMRLLCEHYNVSFLICTATQPNFECKENFSNFPGLPPGTIREIIGDIPSLYNDLKRVEVIIPRDLKTSSSWEEVAARLSREERSLCIVSDRKSCRELYALMPKGTKHLSALMCAQHRSEIITQIKEELKGNSHVRVISTQLVEAGVDLDFPLVLRSLAGLDSIAQAAGRCNREGKLNLLGKLGQVEVFIPPRKSPVGMLRKATETAVRMLSMGFADPIAPEVFTPYFADLYWKANSLDVKGITRLLTPQAPECGIQFRSAAEAFKLIDDSIQRTILVPYGYGETLINMLKTMGPERWLLRKLQRYAVTIYLNQFQTLFERGSIEEISPKLFALTCKMEYDQHVGLLIDEMPNDPAAFMAC